MPPIWREGRAWLEFAQLVRSEVWTGQGVPRGDGRPVMLIPGFLAGDGSLDVLRGWLRRMGYRAVRSGINFNAQSSEVLVGRLGRRLEAEFDRAGRKVTIIGQSRGGVLGLGVAQRHPRMVEQVICLGSPIADPLDVHPSTMAAVQLLRLVNTIARGPSDLDAGFERDLREPVKVPVTSLYSRSDGIVSGRACVRDDVTVIEVGGSHLGMGVNPSVYAELARLLPGRFTS